MTFLVVTGVAICTGSFFTLNSVYQGQFNRSLFDFVSETAGYIRQVSESTARAAANSDTVAANSGVVAEAIQSGSSTLQSSGSALTGFVSTLNDLLAQLTNGSSQNGFILGVAVVVHGSFCVQICTRTTPNAISPLCEACHFERTQPSE